MKEELIKLVESHYPGHRLDIKDIRLIDNNMVMIVAIFQDKPKKVIYELLDNKLIMYSPSDLNESDFNKWKSIMRGAKILQLEEK
jgi:hypothetical protein